MASQIFSELRQSSECQYSYMQSIYSIPAIQITLLIDEH